MKKYLKSLERGSTVKFIIHLALIAFFIKIPAGFLGTYLTDFFGLKSALFDADMQVPTLTLEDTLLAVVVAPFIETLLGQLVPIEVLRDFIKSERIVILLSAGVFMLFHYPVIEFFPAAFTIGIVLAWAWIVKRKLGMWHAIIVVTLIHSLHNAMAAYIAALY